MTSNNTILKKLNNFKIFILDLIPIASNNTPQSDTTTGSSGSNLEYARSDHKHPKSTLYAESEHVHVVDDITDLDIPESFNCGYVDSNLVLHLIYVDGEVTATNSIIQSGDSNTITAVITDKDNNPLQGMPVEFLFDGVKQGQTVNSNANGIATYSYIGTGAGEVDVQVRVGSFQSEIYATLDCIFYDTATSNLKESMYGKYNCSQSFGDDGSTLTSTSDTYYAQTYFGQSTNAKNTFSDGMCFECDITGLTNHFSFGIYGDIISSTNAVANGTKFKVTIKDGTVTFYRDDTVTKTVALSTITSDKYSFFASVIGTGNTVTFKNVKIYPI